MVFEKYSNLEGCHAFMSPSQSHWLRYDDDKLIDRYRKMQAVERGNELHKYAHDAIRLNRFQPRNKDSVNMFVNDAIGYRMSSEQPLFYHSLCFGTADAIDYRKNFLRIHDLKTGETEAHMDQLKVYAALFCLNYQALVREWRESGMGDIQIATRLDLKTNELHFDPMQMKGIELRIYQYGDIRVENPEPEEIVSIMNLIVHDVDVLINREAEE